MTSLATTELLASRRRKAQENYNSAIELLLNRYVSSITKRTGTVPNESQQNQLRKAIQEATFQPN